MSLLFVLNLSSHDHLQVIMDIFTFIERDVPLRFGIASIVHPTDDTDPATLITRGLNYIIKKFGRKEGKQFIVSVCFPDRKRYY
jgi:hypothetical protein